jgi:hypothetical protein
MEDVGYIFWPFGIFYGNLVFFVAIWHILWLSATFFSRFGKLCQEKSGNPGFKSQETNTVIIN